MHEVKEKKSQHRKLQDKNTFSLRTFISPCPMMVGERPMKVIGSRHSNWQEQLYFLPKSEKTFFEWLTWLIDRFLPLRHGIRDNFYLCPTNSPIYHSQQFHEPVVLLLDCSSSELLIHKKDICTNVWPFIINVYL